MLSRFRLAVIEREIPACAAKAPPALRCGECASASLERRERLRGGA